ncbi:MAG: glycosyltransferase [Proteobacteria bacterium]|nr:glycosyltransferase [Pseudomonadota bacterium]
MQRNVLMIAFHFPPIKGSSGIQRTLKFSQYLPSFGWQPIVLSANERAYECVSQEQMGDISPDTIVRRAFALDTKQHLSINGRFFEFLAVPDRWISWFFGGVIQGLLIFHKFKPLIIWSTYPIATAHLIGYVLHRLTGLPWIADLRDPMAQDGYPESPMQWKSFKWIEDRIALSASAICFTSPSAIVDFISKHKAVLDTTKLHLIENGYDEDSFKEAENCVSLSPPNKNRPITLLHSGIVYPSERDPRPFFKALSTLKNNGLICDATLNIILRATGHDDLLAQFIASYGIQDIIQLAPPLPYIEALAEMLSVDGLILLQAANCNYQIPAKLYEYLRAGRPIIGLTDKNGDTASILGRFPAHRVCDIESCEEIKATLVCFINQIRSDKGNFQSILDSDQYSRRAKTKTLAHLFDATASRNIIGT